MDSLGNSESECSCLSIPMSLDGIALVGEEERQRMVWAYSGGIIDDPAMDGKAGERETELCRQSEEEMGDSGENENTGAGDLQLLLDVECPSE